MPTELVNGFGNVYLTIDYQAPDGWVYNDWIGYQSYVGVITGADACLQLLAQHQCAYLLNDNRRVTGPWDHAVQWIANDWAPRAIAQGLTHFANVVSPESMAATSAHAMFLGIGEKLEMRMFGEIGLAQAWLRQAKANVR